jgi:hypothetical protein
MMGKVSNMKDNVSKMMGLDEELVQQAEELVSEEVVSEEVENVGPAASISSEQNVAPSVQVIAGRVGATINNSIL